MAVTDADHATEPRPSLFASSWRGIKVGLRVGSWVGGPIAALVLSGSLAVTAFGLGSGRGLGLHPSASYSLLVYLAFALVGAAIGALVGAVADVLATLTRWLVPPSPAPQPMPEDVVPDDFEFSPDDEVSPPRVRRRVWPRVLLVLASLVLVAPLGLGFEMGRRVGRLVDRRLAAAIAEADRDDPSWRLDDLLAHRLAVPDDKNGALVVAEVARKLPAEGWPPKLPQEKPAVASPFEPPPRDPAYERIAATPDNVVLDDEAAGVLRRDLDAYPAAVQLARTVAAYELGRHEIRIRPNPLDTLLKETVSARDVGRLLQSDALRRAQDGDADGALDSARAILGVARSIGDEPFLISQLVRQSITGVALDATGRALAQGEPTDAALARLQDDFLREIPQPALLVGMKGERAMLTEVIRRIADSEIPISSLSGGSRWDEPVPRVSPWGRVALANQRALAIYWLNEAVAIARRPVHERAGRLQALDASVERRRQSPPAAWDLTLADALMSPVSKAGLTDGLTKARLGATAILLAAERHRLKTGAWPASIAAIDPALLPEPPVDPFTGRPFRLLLVEGELVIYSVGPDLKDDGGSYFPKAWPASGLDDVGARAWDVSLRRRPGGSVESSPVSPAGASSEASAP